jgi:hypothetical protein
MIESIIFETSNDHGDVHRPLYAVPGEFRTQQATLCAPRGEPAVRPRVSTVSTVSPYSCAAVSLYSRIHDSFYSASIHP